MRPILRMSLWLVAACFVLRGGGVAIAEPEGAGAGGREDWRGVIQVIGDSPIEFVVRFGMPPANITTLDIEALGTKGEQLSEVVREEAAMRFTLRFPGKGEDAWARFELALSEDGRSATGTMRQHGQSFPVVMRKNEDVGPDTRGAVTEDVGYSKREISFTIAADGARFAGTLFVPGKPPIGAVADDKKHPAVLILGGLPATDRDGTRDGFTPLRALAEYLAREGVASLRLDGRGVGGSTGAEVSAQGLIGDALGALSLMAVQPDVDATRIVIIGFAEGATIAAGAAAASERVVGSVLLTPRMYSSAVIGPEEMRAAANTNGAKPALIVRGGAVESARYWDQADQQADEALMRSEGAWPVESLVLEGLDGELRHVGEDGKAREDAPLAGDALEAIAVWVKFTQLGGQKN